uniref:Phosphatidylinositide phosphatase SAC1 n=1 Tax=Lygus hesperus TaxID=30085 RepID=A0A0A9YV60_LYGHE
MYIKQGDVLAQQYISTNALHQYILATPLDGNTQIVCGSKANQCPGVLMKSGLGHNSDSNSAGKNMLQQDDQVYNATVSSPSLWNKLCTIICRYYRNNITDKYMQRSMSLFTGEYIPYLHDEACNKRFLSNAYLVFGDMEFIASNVCV